MAINREQYLALGLPTDGETAWGDAVRQNYEVLAQAQAPDHLYFVSPRFTDANLHNAGATTRRHFPTIQEAINAAPAVAEYYEKATVVLYPGNYYENLTINKTICIRSLFPTMWRGLSGAIGAQISGTYGTQAPVITVNPPNGSRMAVTFMGVGIENAYNQNISNISNAQILRVNRQTAYGTAEVMVGFQDCDIRAQTWGLNNAWAYGMWIDGWAVLMMRRCAYAGLAHAGGMNNGGIAHLLYATGDNANNKQARFFVIDTAISHSYGGANFTGNSPSIAFVNDKAAGLFGKCSVAKAPTGVYKVVGTTGSNSVVGLDGDSVSYGNILGVDLAIL